MSAFGALPKLSRDTALDLLQPSRVSYFALSGAGENTPALSFHQQITEGDAESRVIVYDNKLKIYD